MRLSDRRPRWRTCAATAVIVAAASSGFTARAADPLPLQPVIVQSTSATAARAAVNTVIGLTGVGSVGFDLTLVNGVSANLTAVQIGQLSPLVVTPDAAVLTAGKPAPQPPPTPRQLDNVFPEVTGATALVRAGNSGQGVGVAVLDTGIAPLADFNRRLRSGVDLSGEGNAQLDSFGHGTFVAGLVAGDGASSKGTYKGEAPGAHLIPVKVAGRSGATNLSTVIRGLQWIKANTTDNIRVINLSIGAVPTGPTSLNPLNQAVEAMWRSGYVVVASAGNNGPTQGTITSPGDDPLVITVGALDDKDTVDRADDSVPAFSSQGPTAWDGWWKPDLIAPGKSVVSVMPSTSAIWTANKAARVGTKNFVGSGTSFATAIVSGAVTMLLHENPLATPDNVKAALLTTTRAGPSPPQSPFQQGHGVLDVANAVAQPLITVLQDVSSVVPPTVAGTPVSLKATQVVSSWASGDPLGLPLYPAPYPFPYSGPATTDPTLFHSSAWNSSAWNSSAWNSSAWNSSAWNSSAWNSSAWNSSAWNSSAWN